MCCFGEYVKAYKAKRLVVRTEKSMRMLTAEEQSVALLNLAVPSPIFSETEPILALLSLSLPLCYLEREKRVKKGRPTLFES